MMLFSSLLVFSLIGVIKTQECEEVDGVRQSPINIDTSTVIPVGLNPLKWSSGYYEIPDSMSLENDGKSLKLTVRQSSSLDLSSGLLKIPYQFQQLHFHWGDNSYWGSEHQINNHIYPLEMHVLHSQSVNNNTDLFVVVTYFFKVARKNNRGLQNLLDVAIQAAENRKTPISVRPFALSELVSVAPFSYFTYEGSLTTPPFTESVTWIIADNAIPISESQLEILRITANIDNGLKNNFRCLQDLNNRGIRFAVQ